METIQFLARALTAIPPQLATVILAMLPVGELRGALPVALTLYKLPLAEAMFWSIVGNMLPIYFLLVFFEKGAAWLQKHSPLADRLLQRLYERTRRKLGRDVEKYGYWALTIFVAIPLPATGAWSGALAAFVFGLPKKKAFLAILAGVVIAAVAVALLTLGAAATIKRFG